MGDNSSESNSLHNAAQSGHQADEVSVGQVTMIGLILLAFVLLAAAVVGLAFQLFVPAMPLVTADQQWNRESRNPGVAPHQSYDRERIQAEEHALLNQYGWQDQDRGIAQIPIERAIKLMAERKLQVQWSENESAAVPGEADTAAEKESR